MCGRYTLYNQLDEIDHFLSALEREDKLEPNYNAAPTQQMPVAYLDKGGSRVIENMHWGFMGWKPKDGKRPFNPVNTRDDGISKKPMWKRAFEQRRCLVPMNGFYEWKGAKGSKSPYYIYPKNDLFLVAAGIYSELSPVAGTKSYSIITTSPNKILENIHDRMPAFLHPSEFELWLKPNQSPEILLDMLQPYPDDALQFHIVSNTVGNVRNNHSGLIERAELF